MINFITKFPVLDLCDLHVARQNLTLVRYVMLRSVPAPRLGILPATTRSLVYFYFVIFRAPMPSKWKTCDVSTVSGSVQPVKRQKDNALFIQRVHTHAHTHTNNLLESVTLFTITSGRTPSRICRYAWYQFQARSPRSYMDMLTIFHSVSGMKLDDWNLWRIHQGL
jgi:hypothetical protein